MTTVFFVRHAEPNYNNHDDRTRELTEKGTEDSKLVTRFFDDKEVDVVLSSPYKRAIDTVGGLAAERGLTIETVEDFRERRVDSVWIEDFSAFCRAQWENFSYKLSDGESLGEVQSRNISALHDVLKKYCGKTVVIGSHGTALSTVIHYYDSKFGYAEFEAIKNLMPWVVQFTFADEVCMGIKTFDLFDTGGQA